VSKRAARRRDRDNQCLPRARRIVERRYPGAIVRYPKRRRRTCRQAPWVQQVGIQSWRAVHDAIAVRQWALVGDEIGFEKAIGSTPDCRTEYRGTNDNRMRERPRQRTMHDILPLM